MLDIALEIPLPGLALIGFGQGDNRHIARVEMLRHAGNGPAFASRIAPFEHDDDALALGFNPIEHFQQLDLQAFQLFFITLGLESVSYTHLDVYKRQLMRTLAQVNYTELRAAIANTSAEQIALSVLFATISYLALTGYDALALKQLGEKVAYRTTALASFTSYAISFTLGFPLITGGTVRYWIYSRAGLRASKVASLTVIAGVTFWLGMGLVVGACLLYTSRCV